MARTTMIAFPALGTRATLAITEAGRAVAAERILRAELAEFDAACSRFRPDSEISRLHEHAGDEVIVGPLLAEALSVALRAARLTDGLVDPTVGTAVADLGYAADFASLPVDRADPPPAPRPAPGWWRVRLDPSSRRVLLPRTVRLDLGATANALAVDRAARRIAAEVGGGVLVGLGGDVAAVGPPPGDGWRIGIGDDHPFADTDPDPRVTLRSGGMATSGITRRTWRRAGRTLHHIVDPRTGDLPEAVWRTATVAARTCVDANTASTAAIVMGWQAPGWLGAANLPARLVCCGGTVLTIAGWPADDETGPMP